MSKRPIELNWTAEIERKNKEAFNELKDQVAEIAVGAAEKIIRANLDKQKQTELIDKYLKDLNKNWSWVVITLRLDMLML